MSVASAPAKSRRERERQHEDTGRLRGTNGSNPASSSGESDELRYVADRRPFTPHLLDEQIGEGPHQRVDSVWQKAGGLAIKIGGEPAHLVFEHRKRPDVANAALFVERCYRLGADHLAARRAHFRERDIEIDHAQRVLDHLAAVVDLGDDAIGVVLAIQRDRLIAHSDGV